MKKRYFNLIPLLQQQYNEMSESLNEEVLEEDKIPAPLLKAYKVNWRDRYNIATEKQVGYGDDSDKVYPHHEFFSDGKERYSSRWDFGKAYYNKISKQEAVDFLNLKIYSGKGRSAEEISIDDPIPQELTVKCPDDTAQKNINKLRFLLPSTGEALALTEYEYREEKHQFFPIYKQPFNPSVYDENNVTPFKDNRIDYAPKGYSLTGVYYAIKFSELIYQTDEYDHPISDKSRSSFDYWGKNSVKSLTDFLRNYLTLQFIQKFDTIFTENLSTYTNMETYQFDGITETAIKLNRADIKLNCNLSSSTEDFVADINKVKEYDDSALYYLYHAYSNSDLDRYLDRYLSEVTDSVSEKDINKLDEVYKNQYTTEQTNLDNLLKSNQLEQKASKMSQDRFDELIPQGRIKDLIGRRLRNEPRKQMAKASTNGQVYYPYGGWNSGRTNFKLNMVKDTGRHDIKGKIQDFEIGNGNDDLKQMWRNLKDLYNSLNKRRKNYVAALKSLNQIKKNRDHYDSEEEYEEIYKNAYNQYLKAKALYVGGDYDDSEDDPIHSEGIIKKIKKLEDKFLYLADSDLQKHLSKVEKYYLALEEQYRKIMVFRNMIKDITTYTEEDFYALFGDDSNAKQLFDSLNARIEEFLNLNAQYRTRIQEKRNEIEELRARIAELENQIGDTENVIASNEKDIADLEKQKSEVDLSIDNLVAKAYEKQVELDSQVNQFLNNVNQIKRDFTGKDKTKQKNGSAKQLDTRVNDLLSFQANMEKPEQEMPDDDSILSDEED